MSPVPSFPRAPESRPALPFRLLSALLPLAERDEVLAELEVEFAHREQRQGRGAARRWAWWQAAASAPALLRRSAWRGMTGFEPRANRMRPGGPIVESWIIDTRYALRRLASRPLYAALAVLTLALGTGGAAAITDIVRTLLVKPLPYAAEQDLGVFWNAFDWSEQEFLYLRPQFPGFQRVAAYRQEGITLQEEGAPARLVPGVAASAELFDVLGRGAALGRGFAAGDDLPGAEPVAVLSHGLWQDLGREPSIVGRRLRLDGVERTVVGVMPRGFWFPDPTVRVWLAEPLDEANRSGNYALVGRLAPGSSAAALAPQLAQITARLAERYQYPAEWDKTKNARVTPLRQYLLGSLRPALLATLAAMGMILLIASANVASLMLGQVDGRSTELAVRAALGAERGRLAQQLVAEALVIGLASGLVGAAVAAAGYNVLVRALPLGAWGESASLDWGVFAAALAVALVSALLVALVPVLSLMRADLRPALARSRTTGVGARGGRVEAALVVAQVALAVLMAAGAALLVRSVGKLYSIDPGFGTGGLAVLDVAMPADLPLARRPAVLQGLLGELRALPGVRAAAVTHKLPLRGRGSSSGIVVEGRPQERSTTTFFRIVSPGYFEALGVPLEAGRSFSDADRARPAPDSEADEIPVVVNDALAARYFPGEDPLGRIITGGIGARERIVGVVGTVSEGRLTDPAEPARYWLVEHAPFLLDGYTLVLRVDPQLEAGTVLEPARRRVQHVAPALAVQEATTMELLLAEAVGPARQVMQLLALLTAIAVLLGAVGVYGVTAHFVSRRRRDWAIRIALGLAPLRVVAEVVRRGALLVLGGVAIGIACAVLLARVAGSLLYGVGAADPLAMVSAGTALLAIGVGAAFVPAWRASRTQPASVLREE